jgi:predicted Zn-dependent peptidase
MVISVVSNIPFSRFKQIIRNSFFTKPVPKPNNDSIFPSINHTVLLNKNREPQIILHTKKGSSTIMVSISFLTCSHLSPDRYKLNILKQILGGYMSSRLSMILREENGLTYSSSVETSNYEETGCFTIKAETDSKNILKHGKTGKGVLPIINHIIRDLIRNGVTQTEVGVAKGYIHGNLTQKMESMDNIALHNGKHLLIYGNIDDFTPYNQIFDKFYANVTKAEINAIIHKYLVHELMTVCLVGDHLPTINSIRQCIEN